MEPPTPPPLSLLAYAKRRGVSQEAVSKAVREGRLERSVVLVKGKPKIADPDLADREWSERTRPRGDNAMTGAPPAPPFLGFPAEPDLTMVDLDDSAAAPPGRPDAEISYNEARRRREVELWRQARVRREVDELDLAVRRGELVTASEAAETFADIVAAAKVKFLGLPARVKQRAPHLSGEDIGLIDDLVREALEGLADAAVGDAAADDDDP